MDKKRKMDEEPPASKELEEHYKQIFIQQQRKHEQLVQLQRNDLLQKAVIWKDSYIQQHHILVKETKLLKMENERLERQNIIQKQKYEKALSVQYNLLLQMNPTQIPPKLKEILEKSIKDVDLWLEDES